MMNEAESTHNDLESNRTSSESSGKKFKEHIKLPQCNDSSSESEKSEESRDDKGDTLIIFYGKYIYDNN